jgi:hypothetical protein
MPRRFIYPPSPVHGVGGYATNQGASDCVTYASQDFETGTVTAPWTTQNGGVTIIAGAAKNGAYGMQIHYTTPGPAHSSSDKYIRYRNSSGIFVSYSSAWYKVNTPVGQQDAARKLMYHGSGAGNIGDKWSIIMGVTSYTSESFPGNGPLFLSFGYDGSGIGGTTFTIDCGSTPIAITGIGCNMQFDTWYFIEMMAQMDTLVGGPPWDGIVRIWVTPDGGSTELVYENTGQSLNRGTAFYLENFLFGEQLDTIGGAGGDETRYIDDVAVTSCYRNPT